jgi:predicted phage baseplate assembly protein
LAPNLFARRFADLVEIGRARLRPLAPEWTDHNAHDPGITLMELLAWVAEAQLYSLSRLRRDERAAYAALLGVRPKGTQSATGLIWPDRADPASPAVTFSKRVVIPEDAAVHVAGDDSLTFRPVSKLLWTPGRIASLQTRLPHDVVVDHTRVNERGGPAFEPFGEQAGRQQVLALTFQCRDENGLFGVNRQAARGARWAIGVIAAPPAGGGADTPASPAARSSPLGATFVSANERVPLPIVSDTTRGLLATGALLLDLDSVMGSPREFTIELRSVRGSARPPRVLRLEPNVVPIRQGRSITRELHVATGFPDWSFTLDVPGLRFSAGEEPVTVEVYESSGGAAWTRRDGMADSGPGDSVFALDANAAQVTFGNDVNGRMPPAGSQVLVSYAVSDGEQGGVASNRKWRVAGFAPIFGVNPDPVAGGAAASNWLDERRDARRRSRDAHALVSVADIVEAARALPLLEVARAWVVPPSLNTPRTGMVALVVMRSRPSGEEPESIPETRRWLETIQRRLSARMPLASRLAVSAPRYMDFTIRATVVASQGRDPRAIEEQVKEELRRRLALTGSDDDDVRRPGVPLTRRDVITWLRGVDGVARIVTVELRRGDAVVETISVPPSGLPRWIPSQSEITAERPSPGRRQ